MQTQHNVHATNHPSSDAGMGDVYHQGIDVTGYLIAQTAQMRKIVVSLLHTFLQEFIDGLVISQVVYI